MSLFSAGVGGFLFLFADWCPNCPEHLIGPGPPAHLLNTVSSSVGNVIQNRIFMSCLLRSEPGNDRKTSECDIV